MKLENNWRYKTPENLEKINLGDPSDAPTGLVKRTIELSKTPLNNFYVEDIRRMIAQQFWLPYLIPLAVEKLTDNLFAEGDMYQGDLLESVFKVSPEFWKSNKTLWSDINELIGDRRNEIEKSINSSQQFYSFDISR